MKSVKSKLYKHSTTFYRKVKKELEKSVSSKLKTNDPDLIFIGTNGSHVIDELNSAEVTSDYGYDALDEEEYNPCENELLFTEKDEACDDNGSSIEKSILFVENLRKWALEYRIPHSSINQLLKILKSNGANLPSDSRTLLRTPNVINIVPMGTGHYWYHGIENNLKLLFSEGEPMSLVSLVFNVDGLPPFRSSNVEFWPILFKIFELKEVKPMVIALYCGTGKPPLQQYLSCYIEELTKILDNGLFINNKHVQIKIKYFVCDTPARSYIKGTMGFNSTYGCLKCTVEGEYDKDGRHMSFPYIDCPKRTDSSFRNQTHIEHHKERTPLVNLPIDMVEDIIVADSLHLIDLGIMRKCLYGWVSGSFNFRTKLSGKQIDFISQRLEESNNSRPTEIHRAIRKLNVLKLWKGTEYRTFILYLGPIILKDFLQPDIYNHFIILFCIVRILSSTTYLKYIHLADVLIKDYIEGFIKLYGRDSVSSNVHNLCHMIDDVKKFGSLPDISTYPFENLLQYLKSLLRSGNKPLQQMAKRVIELSNLKQKLEPTSDEIKPDSEIKNLQHRHLNCRKVFKKVYFGDKFVLSNSQRDKWFMTTTNEIIEMVDATYYKETLHIFGLPIKEKTDFFRLPIKSSYLDISQSNREQSMPKLIPAGEVKCKLFCLKYRDEFVFVPLLHTVK